MALSSSFISERVINRLDNIGINSKIDGKDSHTAKMIRIMVSEIINAICQEAEVHVVVNTVGGPNAQTGTGIGGIK